MVKCFFSIFFIPLISSAFSISIENDSLNSLNKLGTIISPINICKDIMSTIYTQKTGAYVPECRNIKEGNKHGALLFLPLKITYNVSAGEEILVSFSKDNTENNFTEFNLGCPANHQLNTMGSLLGQTILVKNSKTEICEIEIKIMQNGEKKVYSNEIFINISSVL